VAIAPSSDNPDRFMSGAEVWVGPDEQALVSFQILSSRPHQDKLLVEFKGVDNRDAADRLAGHFIFAPVDDLPDLEEGAFWEHQLSGCEVVDESGSPLGRLSSVLQRPGQDLWVIQTPDEEVLFPAARDLVVSVDVHEKLIVVSPPAGLFP